MPETTFYWWLRPFFFFSSFFFLKGSYFLAITLFSTRNKIFAGVFNIEEVLLLSSSIETLSAVVFTCSHMANLKLDLKVIFKLKHGLH